MGGGGLRIFVERAGGRALVGGGDFFFAEGFRRGVIRD